jgi:predicted DNA-binding transcriptional regulator
MTLETETPKLTTSITKALYKLYPSINSEEDLRAFSKLVKAFRIRGKNVEIVRLLLRARENYLEGFSYSQIQRSLGIKQLKAYLRILREKGLVEKEGKRWRITNFAYFFFAQAKDERWRTKEDLEDLKKRSLEFLGLRIAQGLSLAKLKQKAKLVKITYVYGSHNRKYEVKKTRANLKEDLEKITKDLQERFPKREYELVELPITASKVYVAKEREKDYSIVFHHHQNTVDVFVDYFDLRNKPSYVLWILRTLLYKLRLLEKVEKKNG